ncbi:lactonase family protein [Pendulispora brunnea]|uniref:Lactonase family protein n=1 Tax=Pendulispora brunnea TaxID=2905690 RepID=A0ABZ2JXQ9_9BACT
MLHHALPFGLLLVSMGLLACSSTAKPAVVYASSGKVLRVYDLDAARGELTLKQTLPELENDVHYVAVHPSRKYLYVSCSEIPPPKDRPFVNAIHAFAIDGKTGTLASLGPTYASPLSRAIHVSVDRSGHYLLMAHNFAESASVLRLNDDGSLGSPVQQPEERQHLGFLAHQIRVDPSNRWAFVPVRGNETSLGHMAIFDFRDGVLQKRTLLDYPSGLGPRHLDFHPTKPWVYVAMENGNRLITYEHHEGVLTQRFDTTTLANPDAASPGQGAAAIHVHPSGQWVYVSNRDTTPADPGENSVAVFAIDAATGEPKLVQSIDSHGISPRTMTLDPSGHVLIVANQSKGPGGIEPNLSVFRIGADGKLTYVRTYPQSSGDTWWIGAVSLP